MVSNNVKSLQEFLRANKVFDQFGISRIGVFGSFVREEKYHDIDLLLEENVDYNKRMLLKTIIENAFHTKVDVIVKEFAEPIILHRALREMQYATKH